MLIADLAATLNFVELCEEVRIMCSVAKQQPITLKWIDDEGGWAACIPSWRCRGSKRPNCGHTRVDIHMLWTETGFYSKSCSVCCDVSEGASLWLPAITQGAQCWVTCSEPNTRQQKVRECTSGVKSLKAFNSAMTHCKTMNKVEKDRFVV